MNPAPPPSPEASAFLHAVRPIAADLGSMLLFYAVLALTGDVRAAAALGIALGVGQLVVARVRGRPISAMQLASVGLVVLFGGFTLVTHDARFVLVKATIFYAVLGGSMLKPGWTARYIPGVAAGHLPPGLVLGFERAWASLLLATGAVNLLLAFTVDARTAATIMTIGAAASKITLFAVQYLWMRAVARPRIRAQRAAQQP